MPSESNQNTSKDFKSNLLRYGLFPQYVRRIKNLEKVEDRLWRLEKNEKDPAKILQILINIVNLQTVTANCYVAARETLGIEMEKISN